MSGAIAAEIIDYPMFEAEGIVVDARYKAIQQKGLIKIRLPYGEPCWLATRYDDVNLVYDYRLFSRAMGLEHDAPSMSPGDGIKDPTLLLNMDPPEHTRMRRLAAGAFSPQRIQEVAGWVQEIVDELLDNMVAAGKPADFVSIYSYNLSFRVLTRILGIPAADAEQFRIWVEAGSSLDADIETRRESGIRSFAFARQLIQERRRQKSDDLLSVLVEARDEGDRLSEDELTSLAMSLWFGGFKTTLWQLGATLYTLMTHPKHWQELLENPALLPAALTELWRWVPSFKYGVPFARWAKEDVTFSDGTIVRRGEAVLPEFAVANRDETAFPDADLLDFHRVKPKPHLSFTTGPHACIGQHLAKLQVRLTVETLLRRFPTLRLAIPAEEVVWSKSSFMRTVEALPLEW
jgi:cytochrome P450 RapN